MNKTIAATAAVSSLFVSICIAGAESAPSRADIQSAIRRALPAVAKTVEEYPKKVACFSCHHQGATAIALAMAKNAGFKEVEPSIAAVLKHTDSDLKQDLPLYVKGDGQPGGVTRAGYAMLALKYCGEARGDVTDAVTAFILKRDADQSFWRARSNRPPAEFSNFTDTYLAVTALKNFGRADKQQEVDSRISKAAIWLEQTPTKETEDRVFRLLGLKAAGASSSAVSAAAEELLKAQLPDGGWAQLPAGESDAYATATVLSALRMSGAVSMKDAGFGRGIQYLLKGQQPDGTWHVVTRSHPVQPYFESGFPYGKDQFISVAATAWSIAALSQALGTAP